MVARDYKRSRSRRESFSGWTGMLIGLVGGVLAALATLVIGLVKVFSPRARRMRRER